MIRKSLLNMCGFVTSIIFVFNCNAFHYAKIKFDEGF